MKLRCLMLMLAGFVSFIGGSAALAVDKVSVQFGWLPGGDRAQYYLAKQAGLFQAQGLDVTLLGGKGSSDAITKVATGVADFGEAGLDAILRARLTSGVPIVAVMAVYTKAPDALFTVVGSGITTLKDLVGKKVATSPFTSSNGPWPFLLQMNGVDPSKVALIKADPSTLAPMLAVGQVDAIIQFVNNAPGVETMLSGAGKKMAMIPWSAYGLDGYSVSIFVSEKTLATRRDVVIRFVTALKEAEKLMKSDPDKAAAALNAAIPEADLPLSQAFAKATLPLIFNSNTDRDGLGVFSPDLVRTTWDWVAKQENVSTDKLDAMSIVDLDVAKGH